MIKLLESKEARMPSVINDPFAKGRVINLVVHAFVIAKQWYFRGTVEFENGNTKGEQKFQGNSFDDVVLQIKAMLENLE